MKRSRVVAQKLLGRINTCYHAPVCRIAQDAGVCSGRSWSDPERAVERVRKVQDLEASEARIRRHLPGHTLIPAQRSQPQAALLRQACTPIAAQHRTPRSGSVGMSTGRNSSHLNPGNTLRGNAAESTLGGVELQETLEPGGIPDGRQMWTEKP